MTTDNEYERKRWVIQKLWDMGDKGLLLPRWRGVLLTSDAELETIVAMDRMQEEGVNGGTNNPTPPLLPWVNIKFASVSVIGTKIPANENEEYLKLEKLGIAVIQVQVRTLDGQRREFRSTVRGIYGISAAERDNGV